MWEDSNWRRAFCQEYRSIKYQHVPLSLEKWITNCARFSTRKKSRKWKYIQTYDTHKQIQLGLFDHTIWIICPANSSGHYSISCAICLSKREDCQSNLIVDRIHVKHLQRNFLDRHFYASHADAGEFSVLAINGWPFVTPLQRPIICFSPKTDTEKFLKYPSPKLMQMKYLLDTHLRFLAQNAIVWRIGWQVEWGMEVLKRGVAL